MRLGTCVTNPGTREPSVTASVLATLDESQRRADGSRHRAGRLGPAGPRQAADDDGDARGGDPGDPGARRGRDDRLRGHRAPLPVDDGLGPAGLGRRLRADGARDDRPGRRRGDPPARRPRPDRLVRQPGPRGRGGRRPRPPARSGSRPPRRPTSATSRSCRERTRWFPALVSNHVVDLVNKYPRDQLPERSPATSGTGRATTTTTTPRSARRTPASSATRSTGSASSAPSTTTSPSSAASPTPASTSSTST